MPSSNANYSAARLRTRKLGRIGGGGVVSVGSVNAFGKRRQSHVLILASGDRVRHMTVRPWMATLAICFVGMFGTGYLAATTYLVLRDDLIGGTIARQARMQHEYEDRITALRAQVDRVTSRQLLDQQVVEQKVEKLLQRQLALTSRSGRFGALPEDGADLNHTGQQDTFPATEPLAYDGREEARGGVKAIETIMGIAGKDDDRPPRPAVLGYAPVSSGNVGGESASDRADRMFSNVTLSLKGVEREQMAHLRQMTESALRTSATIRAIVEDTGFTLPEAGEALDADTAAEAGIGGPFAEPQDGDVFDRFLVGLDSALLELEQTRDAAKRLPLASPAPAADVSSGFGNRLDPFLGRPALHAGTDFRAPTGTRVRATAGGTVTAAGPAGGYGNMIEIDHGNGVSTRYAHLSAILVNVGDAVKADAVIAKSGSTGRSTGPHLHYEVRLNGHAVDPARFLRAGTELAGYLD
ncbi:M23 family metallopeptidase [Sinorhizobium meliloti]|uniref:M23 family metallopeptidase n=1 Tax=Rhizobium meliloti TaxID=382 RepID=UPI0004809A44|nr:M23 family metallopeptidase [Sinorhizobium meliloti]MDE4620670.1 M23 family metallopeptidase [Sinorhizobium meliloti]